MSWLDDHMDDHFYEYYECLEDWYEDYLTAMERVKLQNCPYCGTSPKLNGDGKYLKWECPKCKAYSGYSTGRGIPTGTLADESLRSFRKTTHHFLDSLWETEEYGLYDRSDAYEILQEIMGLPSGRCHIGVFTVDQCSKAINGLLKWRKERRNNGQVY